MGFTPAGMTPMIGPDGSLADIPNERVPDAVKGGGKTGIWMLGPSGGAPAVIPHERMLDAIRDGARPMEQMPNVQMQTSSLPGLVRGATQALPVLGGLGGGLAGAASTLPTIGGVPAGTVVGAGLGAAAGESGRQAILRNIFGPQEAPSPISKEGLTQTGIAGAVGSASELGGALLSTYGNVLLKRLGAATSAGQVGDAVDALKALRPGPRITQGMITDALDAANSKLSSQLGSALGRAQGQVDIDSMLGPVRMRAASEDAAFARPGAPWRTWMGAGRVSNKVNDVIAAAKSQAGITGNTANPQQLATFWRAINKEAFAVRKIPGVGSVASDVAHDAYNIAGQQLRQMAPGIDPILEQMSDVWAAKNAIRNYPLGKVQAMAVTAATNPRMTALVSPGMTALAATGGQNALERLEQGLQRFAPTPTGQ